MTAYQRPQPTMNWFLQKRLCKPKTHQRPKPAGGSNLGLISNAIINGKIRPPQLNRNRPFPSSKSFKPLVSCHLGLSSAARVFSDYLAFGRSSSSSDFGTLLSNFRVNLLKKFVISFFILFEFSSRLLKYL